MKTWDDWSDSETTIAVSNITRKHHDAEIRNCGEPEWIGDEAGTHAIGEVVVGWSGQGADEEPAIIDYCNSWADMGPLIEDNDITTGPCSSGRKMAASYRGGLDDVVVFDNKTCRAAAITFLIMNGVNPA